MQPLSLLWAATRFEAAGTSNTKLAPKCTNTLEKRKKNGGMEEWRNLGGGGHEELILLQCVPTWFNRKHAATSTFWVIAYMLFTLAHTQHVISCCLEKVGVSATMAWPSWLSTATFWRPLPVAAVVVVENACFHHLYPAQDASTK